MSAANGWQAAEAARLRRRADEVAATLETARRRVEAAKGREGRRQARERVARLTRIWLDLRAEAAALDPPERRRFGAHVCARCLGPREPRRHLCARCAETHGYCAACKAVHPLADFPPPTPSAQAAGQRHDPTCYAGRRRRQRAQRGSAPCPRCGGPREGHRRLCPACAATHGVCQDCGVQPLAAFPAPAPSHLARGQAHAPRCRACARAANREYRRARRQAAAD